MSKKIMILCGSPNKKGNTNTVVEWATQGAKEADAEVEVINLASLKYKVNGCIACMGCHKSDKYECVNKDEAGPILTRIPELDVLVFATPLYFFGPSAQLKLFLDRMYSLFKYNSDTKQIKHNLMHVTFALISTAGGNEFSALRQMFTIIARFFDTKLKSLLVPFAGPSGNIKNNKEVREKAVSFGRQLSSSRD